VRLGWPPAARAICRASVSSRALSQPSSNRAIAPPFSPSLIGILRESRRTGPCARYCNHAWTWRKSPGNLLSAGVQTSSPSRLAVIAGGRIHMTGKIRAVETAVTNIAVENPPAHKPSCRRDCLDSARTGGRRCQHDPGPLETARARTNDQVQQSDLAESAHQTANPTHEHCCPGSQRPAAICRAQFPTRTVAKAETVGTRHHKAASPADYSRRNSALNTPKACGPLHGIGNRKGEHRRDSRPQGSFGWSSVKSLPRNINVESVGIAVVSEDKQRARGCFEIATQCGPEP
jgi:hypothetical protein